MLLNTAFSVYRLIHRLLHLDYFSVKRNILIAKKIIDSVHLSTNISYLCTSIFTTHEEL